MPYSEIREGEMSRIMGLLNRVLDIRITFFDLHEAEVKSFQVKGMSAFCRKRRRNPEFNSKCILCDRKHLEQAKERGGVRIYRCHAGLLEGIVPFYNRRGVYLGAVVFGQLADAQTPVPGLRTSSVKEMRRTGALLKYLSEYICENELVRQCARPWGVQLEEYVGRHLAEKITLSGLAAALGKSLSFLSHGIPQEFGMSLKKYVRRRKMEEAVRLLESDRRPRECAFELGYADEFYFSRDFKRYYRSSPKVFRRSHAPLPR